MITTEKRHLYTLIVVIFALFGYREWITQSTPINLFFDEAYYYGWSQSLDWGYYSKPPMVAWIIRVTTDLFGASEWAIKISAPLLYSCTALIIYSLGKQLDSLKAGLYAALLFISMPLVSFNSLFITTDAPLLFFWASALWVFLKAQQNNDWQWWILAGLLGGLGLLSKYTFILFPTGFLLYALLSEEGKKLLANFRFWVACTLAITILTPKLWWNYNHDFISFQHTAEISEQGDSQFSLSRFIEFLLMQFLVFGPITMIGLLIGIKKERNEKTKLLWALFIPIFAVISFQALSAKANINWGAPAYITGSLIAAIVLAKFQLKKTLITALSVNLVMMIGFYHYEKIQSWMGIEPNTNNTPFTRIQGWAEVSDKLAPTLNQYQDIEIASDSRKVAAYIGYYREPKNLNARALNLNGHIESQYELLYGLESGDKNSYLFVSENLKAKQLSKYFESVTDLTTQVHVVTEDRVREVHVTLVNGVK